MEPVAQTWPITLRYFQMPRLWLDYCQFLMDQGRVTHTRRTFDRALRALPITQHSRIWPLYLRFLRSHPLPETAVRGYRRFLKVSTTEQSSCQVCFQTLAPWDKGSHATGRLQEEAPMNRSSLFVIFFFYVCGCMACEGSKLTLDIFLSTLHFIEAGSLTEPRAYQLEL